MRKIKTYISNLPIGVKWIVGINLLVYLMSIIVGIFFNIRLQDYLGAYPILLLSKQFQLFFFEI